MVVRTRAFGRPARACLVLVLAVAAVAPGLPAAAQSVPADLETVILLRALSYDRNLKRRSGTAVKLGLVYAAGEQASEDCRARISAALRGLTTQTVQDLPITVTDIALRSTAQLESEVATKGLNLLYVCDGVGDRFDAITTLSRAKGVLTMCGSEALVRQGLALGVAPKGDTAKIVVNLRAARDEGADFDSRLLMMAEVVK